MECMLLFLILLIFVVESGLLLIMFLVFLSILVIDLVVLLVCIGVYSMNGCWFWVGCRRLNVL